MLSTTADHALRAVLFLGAQRDAPVVSADEIARAIGAPSNYLSKTLNALTKAGITASTPGRYGGFSLAVPVHRLTVHDIVKVFDAPDGSSHCLLGARPCNPARPCVAHRRWVAIDGVHGAALRATTIADLLGQVPVSRSS
jgi:Rrf2 family protein